MSKIKRLNVAVALADGSEHEITVGNPSLVAYDRTRAKRKWPASSEAPILWTTFIAWHHMKAVGLYDGTADQFIDHDCVAAQVLGDDDNAGEEVVDPTNPAAEGD